jgi:hypothetical protein
MWTIANPRANGKVTGGYVMPPPQLYGGLTFVYYLLRFFLFVGVSLLLVNVAWWMLLGECCFVGLVWPGKLVTIIDMKGLGFSQIISGPVKQLLKRTVKTGSEYYPERTLKTFIVNVPTWFSMVWNIVKSFLTERSVAKISILKSNYSEELEALIPKENIPSKNKPVSVVCCCDQLQQVC